MNNLIKLNGNLLSSPRTSGGSGSKFYNETASVDVEMIDKLISNANSIKRYWENHNQYINNCLVYVQYIAVVPKSRRISSLLLHGNDVRVVGARFVEDEYGDKVHAITYLTDLNGINETILALQETKDFVLSYGGSINNKQFQDLQNVSCKIPGKTKIIKRLADISNINKFGIPMFLDNNSLEDTNIISIYETGNDIDKILDLIGIHKNPVYGDEIITKKNIVLSKEEAILLNNAAPYLVSMSCPNFADFEDKFEVEDVKDDIDYFIEKPNNEPIIGVIDTLFDENVYFKDWVEYVPMLSDEIISASNNVLENKMHGTYVDSIIVDGPTLNPDLDDHCGHFRVRHFGVATKDFMSRFEIINAINKIVRDPKNKDIHVYNISLGSIFEISENYISPEAALLDQLQNENPEIVFVIAGTNDADATEFNHHKKRIGVPADSLNSFVVNSCRKDGTPAIYSRRGEVLSFFIKPDVCYYGGDIGEEIIVRDSFISKKVTGTSFAAPFIARKLAYLMDILDLPREVAKALLIDSSIQWNPTKTSDDMQLYGYGVVPIHIEDVIKSKTNNEIKFYIEGQANEYSTSAYNIPVPIEKKDGTMYVARAVLCYSPRCSREQGVDYTNTELSLSFGRVNVDNNGVANIQSIDNNTQEDKSYRIKEKDARKLFRKWDNVKRISEKLPIIKNPKCRKCAGGRWGFSVRMKERLNDHCDRGIPFGLVVTLYEKNFKNKQDEFIKNCFAQGWLVEEIDIDSKLDIYETMQEDIDLD